MPHEANDLEGGGQELGGDDALVADAQATDDQVAQGRQEEIAAAAPQATELLEPAQVNTLSQTVADVVGKLSQGQFPPIEPIEIPEPVDVLPAPLFSTVMAVAAMVDEAASAGLEALAQYAFDPTELAASNGGLFEMAKVISAMGEDEKVVQAMNQPLPGGEAPGGEPPAEDGAPPPVEGGETDEFEELV